VSSPFQDRLFRGYGPLIGFTAVFLAVVLLVPSKAPEGVDADLGEAESVAGLLGEGDEDLEGEDAATDSTDSTDTTVAIDPETGLPVGSSGAGGGSAGKDASSSTSKKGGGSTAGGSATDPKAPAKIAGCGAAQIPNDPYSPPCIQWSGGNGGATAQGVTPTEIVVTVRIDGFANGILDAVSKEAGAVQNLAGETPERIQRTVEGLVEYFNRRFQFYGRKIKLVVYDGKGDILQETLGKGQEGAQADALKVAQEYKAFADVSAVSAPYADALSKKGIINMGVPYVSRDWLNAHKPYSWTQFTDCSTVVESVASYYATKMFGQPAANAGAGLSDKPRRTAVVAPSNQIYQECVNAGIALLERSGKAGELAMNEKYELVATSQPKAKEIANKLKLGNITTVICGCDPIFLKYLTAELGGSSLQYYPEFVVTGMALADSDTVGALFNQEVWRHAFGVSFAGPTQPQGQGIGYKAYKTVRPEEPSIGVELIYNQLYLLAIGVQMAGPNLTVASFEKGMFDYPRRSGPYGTWGFAAGDYSTSDDAREIHWNPSTVSVESRRAGAYVDSNNGARFPIGKWPGGSPKWAG
jgi:hypothetical protein